MESEIVSQDAFTTYIFALPWTLAKEAGVSSPNMFAGLFYLGVTTFSAVLFLARLSLKSKN